MPKDNITEKRTWEEYWASYRPELIEKKNQFTQLFKRVPDAKTDKTFLEIGGFPGTFPIYFKKFKNYRVSLLDYYIDYEVINSLLSKNSMKSEDLEVIEGDMFNLSSKKSYDIVFSSGLIEHFKDTRNVIERHLDFLSENGTVLITLPNLRGINGWVQRIFDPSNYAIHNIDSMDVEKLNSICRSLGINDLEVGFYGKPMIWLEPQAKVSGLTRKIIKLISLSMKLIPLKGYKFSPYIYIIGKK